jgi:Arc/MetJ-type ribon-helix-helix transcriptional regulator
MATIPINLDNETVKRLDTLVLQGIYKNRTEAIRDQIMKGLAQIEAVIFPKKSSKYNHLLRRLLDEKVPLDIFKTTKSAVELVAEGRTR